MKTSLFLLIILLFLSFGFKVTDVKISPKKTGNVFVQKTDEAYTLLKQRCMACHSETPGYQEKMIAPPIIAIQMKYKRAYPEKEKFIQAIVNWVQHPDAKKSLMPGAVKKFKLMPALPYPEKDLRLIAKALYQYNFSKKAHRAKSKHMRCGQEKCGKCGK